MRGALPVLALVACYTPPDLPVVPYDAPILSSADGPLEVCAPERDVRVGCAIDGDTMDVNGCRDDAERIRMLGVDTPETAKPGQAAECFADVAFAELARVLDGRVVRLSFDAECTDVTGSARTLAYVWLEEPVARVVLGDDVVEDVYRIHGDEDDDETSTRVLLNTAMLVQGFARHYDVTTCNGCVTPRLDADFAAAARVAQARGAGLWSVCE